MLEPDLLLQSFCFAQNYNFFFKNSTATTTIIVCSNKVKKEISSATRLHPTTCIIRSIRGKIRFFFIPVRKAGGGGF